MKKRNIILMLVFLSIGAVIGRTILKPSTDPPEPVYLPAETIIEEVVPQELLDKVAALSLSNANFIISDGELRDENGRLLKVVRSISVDTGEVEESAIVSAGIICPDTTTDTILPIRRYYRAQFDAFQFEGLDSNNENVYGWKGEIRCEVRTDAVGWTVLVARPLSLSRVEIAATAPPAPPQRIHRWWASIDYAVLSNSTSFQFDQELARFSPSSLRFHTGMRLFPRANRSPMVGIWVDSRAVGISAGLSW